MLAGIGVVVVVVLLLAGFAIKNGSASSASSTPTAVPPGKTIAGIGCNYSEIYTYHQHAHLAMYDHGKAVTMPSNIGFDYNHDCLYWMHSHSPSENVIHMEAPHTLVPRLQNFVDIWKYSYQTQSISQNVWPPLLSGTAPGMKVWVNQKPYSGNPLNIRLKPHTNVTIEVGPPYVKPKPFTWGSL